MIYKRLSHPAVYLLALLFVSSAMEVKMFEQSRIYTTARRSCECLSLRKKTLTDKCSSSDKLQNVFLKPIARNATIFENLIYAYDTDDTLRFVYLSESSGKFRSKKIKCKPEYGNCSDVVMRNVLSPSKRCRRHEHCIDRVRRVCKKNSCLLRDENIGLGHWTFRVGEDKFLSKKGRMRKRTKGAVREERVVPGIRESFFLTDTRDYGNVC